MLFAWMFVVLASARTTLSSRFHLTVTVIAALFMVVSHVVNRTVIRKRARERFRRLYIDARPPCASCGFDGIPPRCAECGTPLDDKENRETWAMLYKKV